MIAFPCECGNRMAVSDDSAGREDSCPKCGRRVIVPSVSTPVVERSTFSRPVDDDLIPLADDRPALSPRPSPPPMPVLSNAYTPPPVEAFVRPGVAARRSSARAAPAAFVATPQGLRRHLYWILLLVLAPLAWSTLHHAPEQLSIEDRFSQVVQHHPEVEPKLEALPEHADKAMLFAALPDDRLEGALLPEQTYSHWAFALASGVCFVAAALILFPGGHAGVPQLVGVAIATGTIGIFLLLGFQWLAFHMPLFRGHGMITLALDLVWLIGQSYRMALGDHGFLLSFLGFTAGVGFCEEACKALPLLLRANHVGYSTWRSAMLWGLVSGIGFGVSEGITYSSDYYNGIEGAEAYVVRFVSCVGLHAIWAAAVGITIFRNQDAFRGFANAGDLLIRVLQAVLVPMILHGLYDTLLKQDHDAWALVVAVVSFGWLAWQIERAQRDFGESGAMTADAAMA